MRHRLHPDIERAVQKFLEGFAREYADQIARQRALTLPRSPRPMADLTPEMRAEMRRRAEAATPGPWLYGPLESKDCTWTVSLAPIPLREGKGAAVVAEVYSKDDRDFIAGVDPQTVIAFLDYCDRMERERDADHERMREMAEALEPFATYGNGGNGHRAARVLADYRNDPADRSRTSEGGGAT